MVLAGVALAAVPDDGGGQSVRANVYPPTDCPGGVRTSVYAPNCLSGTISDAATHATIAGASVQLQRCAPGCVNVGGPQAASAGGVYSRSVANGSYRVVATKAGYQPKASPIV